LVLWGLIGRFLGKPGPLRGERGYKKESLKMPEGGLLPHPVGTSSAIMEISEDLKGEEKGLRGRGKTLLILHALTGKRRDIRGERSPGGRSSGTAKKI